MPVSLGDETSLVTTEGQTLSVSQAEALEGHHHVELAQMIPEGQVIHTTTVDMSEAMAVELSEGAVQITEEDLVQDQHAEFVTTSVGENMIQIAE